MSDVKVYIVILNYKQWEVSLACLQSVLQSGYTGYAVVIIDNCSGNRSLELLKQEFDRQNDDPLCVPLMTDRAFFEQNPDLPDRNKVLLVQNNENKGFAAGNNLALNILKEKPGYIWLLNPDMTVLKDTLQQLVTFASHQDPATIIGANVKYDTDREQQFFYGGARLNFRSGRPQMIRTPAEAGQLDYISGGCLFTRAGSFKQLGLLPEYYFLYWEETEWCYTARQKGYVLVVCGDAICYDKISTSIGKGYLSDYYYSRNGLHFMAKFRRRNLPFVLLFMILRWLRRLLSFRWQEARGMFWGTVDFFKGKKFQTH